MKRFDAMFGNERRVLLAACLAVLILPTVALVSEIGGGEFLVTICTSVAGAAVLGSLVAQSSIAGVAFAGFVSMSPFLFLGLFASANGGSLDIVLLIPFTFVLGSVCGAIVIALSRFAEKSGA